MWIRYNIRNCSCNSICPLCGVTIEGCRSWCNASIEVVIRFAAGIAASVTTRFTKSGANSGATRLTSGGANSWALGETNKRDNRANIKDAGLITGRANS